MTPRKKGENRSTSETTSGASTSGTSTSASSTSGSSSSSTDSDSSCAQNKTQSVVGVKKPPQVQKSHPKSTDSKNATKTRTKVSKNVSLSTDDDDSHRKSSEMASKVSQSTKRRSNAKPKTSATITPKLMAKVGSNKISHKNSDHSNANKTISSKSKTNKVDLKKKSIFSPENSSESDNQTSKLASMKLQAKNSNQKPRTKASPRTVPKNTSENTKHEQKFIRSKLRQSSATSASTTTGCSSGSDTDASRISRGSMRSKMTSKIITKGSHTDTDDELNNKMPRKLTRSSNTRKSIHVLGKTPFSESDSDSESTKRSLSHSPVKKAPAISKGKVKNTKRNEGKVRVSEIVISEERRCPIEGCNSNGHLGGRQDNHFTIEGCLLYHNLTTAQSKVNYIERKKREDIHKKALDNYKKIPRSHTSSEQKQYLLKIKEARSKFKAETAPENTKVALDKNKEPLLNGIVPDYDLKLFRDAQAIASEKIEEELKSLPNFKGTKYIEMGKFEMEVWYQSPYPEDFARVPKLYICEFCLRYMKSRTVLLRHVVKCVWRHPPGEEVYRKDKIGVWEVDGKRYKQYCQNLCLLAKFFLDHKTLYYDVEPFLFYVMTLADREGCHTVGYFSKEKNSFLNYNVSCILTLPPYQRQGYGRLLIDFSYLLTRVEGKIGSPEKPLSDLGLISYRSYWKDVLLDYLCSRAGVTLSVKDISQEMAIHSYDIVSTLQALGMMKYWKGKHIILKKQDVLDEYVERVKRRGSLLKEVDPEFLRWKPFVPPQPAPV